MKVLHVESGLGNQMLDYVEYLAAHISNPNEDCYVETILSEIRGCSKVISQWNGYELERIFPNVRPLNIKTLFEENVWDEIVNEVEKSEFWEEHWNYSPYIVKALNEHGLKLENRCDSLDRYYLDDPEYKKNTKEKIRYLLTRFFRTELGNLLKRKLKSILRNEIIKQNSHPERLFVSTDKNLYMGHTLLFKYKGNQIEKLDTVIREAFQFPDFTDQKNKEFVEMLKSTDSVAIHARRGDMISCNFECYQFGYFKRAVRYIRQRVNNPVFVFFCDSESIFWCKQNKKIFDIDTSKDRVYFVDWNVGLDSYKDMQLMKFCKHNIITTSTFGWWGAFLNENPQKITISPDWGINTTHTL